MQNRSRVYAVCVFCLLFYRCVQLVDAGGALSGEVALDAQFAGFRGAAFLAVSRDPQLHATLSLLKLEFVDDRAEFTVRGLENGPYYLWAFADTDGDGVFDLNAPSEDAALSEPFGIYGPSGTTFPSPNPYPILIQDYAVDGIQIYLGTRL